ncbi:MAG: response regulator [Gammaproteobacteria bacterium]|nr:response regulator [Gammaproteobacteria bacterium]
MKLRTLIFSALILVSVLPVGILAYWQHQTALSNEFSVVENQHKVIAKNLTIALERYATDLRSAFQMAIENIDHAHKIQGLEQHLSELYFQHVCTIDPEGNVQRLQCAMACPQGEQFPQAVLSSIQETIQTAESARARGKIHFSRVTRNPKGRPAIYLVKKLGNGNTAIGEVSTKYFIELQRAVSFGVKGHAAIVDQSGLVIAHPLKDWMESLKDLSGVSVVQQMLNGENGVTRFYSPTVKADMVAGFNVVADVGWGVMVPQPQSEIYLRAESISRAALTIAIMGMLVASFLSWWISGILSRPMQLLADAAQSVARGDLSAKVDLSSRLRPVEILRLEKSFNQMVDELGRKNTVLVNLAHEAVISSNHKSAFISSMNHELRTPMNAVLGFAQMLEINTQEPLTDNQKSAVEHILRNGNHLLELIDQMLELNKIEAGTLPLNMEDIPARDVFDESIYLIRARANNEDIRIVDETVDQDTPLLWTDSTRLIQVLLNLMTNAIKYNHEGGTVTLSCHEVEEQMLRISVADDGVGIPEALQGNLFEPFERLGHELGPIDGSGIGLSITRQIVEMLDGNIGFESTQDEGSTFWVDIALSNQQSGQLKKEEAPTVVAEDNNLIKGDGKARTVLYIEDNPDNLHLVEAIITQFSNVELLSAPNAIIGYDLSTSKKPDLILMDINLPGMNGVQALKRLRDTPETHHIPVIAVTSNSLLQDITAGLRAGFNAYITKPIKISELIRTVDQLLYGDKKTS